MQLQVNWTYKFFFIDGFDLLNGIYKVVKIYSYQELLDEALSLYDDLYKHVGKTEEELETDITKYNKEPILKLVSVDDSTKVYYVPLAVLLYTPDLTVKPYSKIAIGVNVGPIADPEQISHIVQIIKESISKQFGVTNDPQLFNTGTVWLTDAEYAVIEADRKTAATEIINYYGENQKLRADIQKLKEQLAVYETYFRAHRQEG